MTDEELEAIRARAKVAGDQVWRIPDGDLNGSILCIGPISGYDGDALGLRDYVEEDRRIAEFVAHAPADVAALLVEVERLRAEKLDLYRALEVVLKATDAAEVAIVGQHPIKGAPVLQAVHAAQNAAFGTLMKQPSDEARALRAQSAEGSA